MEKNCPKCGHQISSVDSSLEECPRCGIIYSRYAAMQEKQKNAPKPDSAGSKSDSQKRKLFTLLKYLYKIEEGNISHTIGLLGLSIAGIVFIFLSSEIIITQMYGEKIRANVLDTYTESGGKGSRRYVIEYIFKTKDRKVITGKDETVAKIWRNAEEFRTVDIVYRRFNPEKNFVHGQFSYKMLLLPAGFLMMIYGIVGLFIQFGVIDTDE